MQAPRLSSPRRPGTIETISAILVHVITLVGLVAFPLSAPLADAQQRQPRPVIERLEPTAGPAGARVEVVGRFFRGDQRLWLGEAELTVTGRLPNRWTATVPEGARTGRISIRLADGTQVQGPEFRVLASVPTPSISGFSPSAGAAGTEVRIAGENFSPRLTDNLVTLGSQGSGASTLVVRRATPTELTVIIPAGAASGRFTVRVAGSGEATAEAPFEISVGTAITRFEPRTASPGMRVTIVGTGFGARGVANRVFLENTALRVVSSSETEFVVELPPRAQTGRLLVDVRGGGRAYAEQPLEIFPMPTFTRVDPPRGTVGATIELHGTEFGSDVRRVRVSLGERPLAIRAVTPTRITATLPEGVSSGTIALSVNELPALSSPTPFLVVEPVRVEGFEPTSGPAGAEVTIRGRGFSLVPEENSVTIAAAPCAVVAATATELRVRVPETGSGRLVVSNPYGGSANAGRPFVVTTPPTIARIEPSAGTVGSSVRLFGANFGTNPATVEVAIGATRMDVRSVRDTEIEAVIPRGAASGPISVSVRLQGSATSSASFTVLREFAVRAVEPAEAHAGSLVTVRGQGFSEDGLEVRFAGASAPSPSIFVSERELRALVPADATSGPVTVRLADGRALETPSFTPTPAPAGVGISHVTSSCARTSCTVTLYGWGFGARPSAQRVTFGGTPMTVRRASPHALELTSRRARMPAGVSTTTQGTFTVAVRGQAPVTSEAVTIQR